MVGLIPEEKLALRQINWHSLIRWWLQMYQQIGLAKITLVFQQPLQLCMNLFIFC